MLLDWYGPHLSQEVQDCVERLGHVLLHHGGGVTGAEQINDTHVHALVQRIMEELEIVEQSRQRAAQPDKVPRNDRQTIIDLVREMWLSIDHQRVAETGYQQLGPMLPFDAGVEAIFKDLQPFWEKLDGETLRRDAVHS